MSNILIVDDEAGIRTVLGDILTDEHFTVFTAADGLLALDILKIEPIDLLFLDVWLPNMGGIELLELLRERYPLIQVILISGHATIDIAVKAIKMGAFDFIEKPIDINRVITAARNALKVGTLTRENLLLKKGGSHTKPMIGSSESITLLKQQALQAAKSNASCLITGENGSGKELVAQMIHYQSNRASYNFVEVNCAAIPENLIESEFFGYEKGAFTGATATKIGKFELAHRGTLFLDEIADLSLNAQAKLLRALQEQCFCRVGGNKIIKVDLHLVAATNKNLQEAIKAGLFREDLFFRISVLPLAIKPLRERSSDIEELLYHFINEFNPNSSRLFSTEALKYLKKFKWPGNVRQLRNFCERLTILSDSKEFSLAEIQHYLDQDANQPDDATNLPPLGGMKLNEARDLFERKMIEQSIKECGTISLAAERLGLYPSNLHAKIKKLGVEVKK